MGLVIYIYISGQIIIFHQPRFPWNKGISLTKLPFKVRSCEVAIIWVDISTRLPSKSTIHVGKHMISMDAVWWDFYQKKAVVNTHTDHVGERDFKWATTKNTLHTFHYTIYTGLLQMLFIIAYFSKCGNNQFPPQKKHETHKPFGFLTRLDSAVPLPKLYSQASPLTLPTSFGCFQK